MRRSLVHYWSIHLAVAAAIAITTAVLTGSLVVGDSLRGSLRQLTLDRLGSIETALINQRFFPADLVTRLAARSSAAGRSIQVTPAILLRGSAHDVETDLRASGLQILGVDRDFVMLYPEPRSVDALDFNRRPGQVFPTAIANQALADELDLKVGDDLLLSFGSAQAVPTASLLGRRDESDVLTTLRVTVNGIVPVAGAGRFSLEAKQNRPLNLFVELTTLQRRLDRSDHVNLALIQTPREPATASIANLEATLRASLTPADLGLVLHRYVDQIEVQSTELILRPEMVQAIDEFAAQRRIPTWKYLTYLANTMRHAGHEIPYSTIAAIEVPVPIEVGTLLGTTREPAQHLAPGSVLVNQWAAEDLDVAVGQPLDLTYYRVDTTDALITSHTELTVAGIVDLESLGADASLTPEVPGISDADHMADWDPPFPVDLTRVRGKDEAYWDRFGAAPKAFVSLGTGQDLWRSRYGDLTGIRLVPSAAVSSDEVERALVQDLPATVRPEATGYRWLPVRAQGLRGATGTTDFAGLFVGFSLFLIVSSALLVALLFSLMIEQRCREAGLLLAIGFPPKRVRWRFLREGGAIAIVGILVGTVVSVVYTELVLRGLAVWWRPIMDSPILDLHVRPVTLFIGAAIALLLSLFVIAMTVRRLAKIPLRMLLAGSAAPTPGQRTRNRAPVVGVCAASLAILMLATALILGLDSAPALFFGIGAALLIAGLAYFVTWSRSARHDRLVVQSQWVLPRLAARNSSRNMGRSLLSVTLVASASFVLVSVSASRKTHHDAGQRLDSGTGGYTWVAESATPLPRALGSISSEPPASAVPESPLSGSIQSLRLLPGDDASCLNLYQPETPRILGVPASFVDRGGFAFQETIRKVENPWSLLSEPLPDGAIPAIGDVNSVRWILHSGLGQEIELDSGSGAKVRLRIVGLLKTSLFQSELLIGEGPFLQHFPDRTGFSYFLGDSQAGEFEEVRHTLEQTLDRFGLDVESAVTRLAEYQAVENMYLTTFEALGGLGLLLGTIGLGVVLLRNTLERRGELAVLRAFGYRRGTLAWMVVLENALLLLFGLSIGSFAGLIAVGPYLWSGGIAVPWGSLLGILLAVFVVGMLASLAAVGSSLRAPLLPALKSE